MRRAPMSRSWRGHDEDDATARGTAAAIRTPVPMERLWRRGAMLRAMTTATRTAGLLNPGTYDAGEFDPATRRLLRATIEWFEAKGKRRLIDEMHTEAW